MSTIITPEQIKQEKLYIQMGLTDEEYDRIKQLLGRLPNYTETGIFSVMWSEHCSYKSSKPLLGKFPTKGPQVLMGPGEGAGVVDIGDNQAVVFKIESHNSPSTVDPYEGAATGVGGILRDVFSMGARPIAVLNSLRFGNLTNERTKYLLREVVRGMANYSKHVGVPTVGGEIQFDDCYEQTPLVNAMAVGLINHDDLQKGLAAGIGNTVIYAGAPTGRDGIHGATHSSDDQESEDASPAPGNPHLEKRLIEACLEVVHSDALVGMQDMGAAGLTSSGSEMASKAGTGMLLNLDDVPQAESGMSAYEMMLSETQERMLLVVKKGHEDEIIDIFAKHDVEAVAVGEVIAEKAFRIQLHGKIMADIPVDTLDKDAPVYHLPAKEAAYFKEFQQMDEAIPHVDHYGETLKKLLQQPTIASKQWIFDQFDANSQGKTLVGPGAGAAIVQIEDQDKAIAMTTDCNARYIYLDPETGGKIAVAEAARNLVCAGAKPIGLTDGLNYGNPNHPEVFWQMEKSIDGISEACRKLDIPVISGNVSLYNQSADGPIFPTPIIGMVGLFKTLEHITPNHFQEAGHVIYQIGETTAAFGGSELQNVLNGNYEGKAPEIDLDIEIERQKQLLTAIQKGLVSSATDIAEGGLAVTLVESLVNTTGLGVEVHCQHENPTVLLFSESQSRFLVSVKKENTEAFENIFPEAVKIGQVTSDERVSIQVNDEIVIDEELQQLRQLWQDAIPQVIK